MAQCDLIHTHHLLIYSKGVPGTGKAKRDAVEQLAQFWKKRCGLYPKESDELLLLAWSTVAREAIIHTLISKSGLQVKLSANSKKIFCRIRAPVKLLEIQADKDNYRYVENIVFPLGDYRDDVLIFASMSLRVLFCTCMSSIWYSITIFEFIT